MRPSRILASSALALLVGLIAFAGLRDQAEPPGSLASAATGSEATTTTPSPATAPGSSAAPSADSDTPADGETAEEPAFETVEVAAPPMLGKAKAIDGLDGWLQTDATSFEEIDAPVRVVQFWTFGCINCKNTLANMAGLYELHKDEGLEVIGVHAPEFEFEKDPASIAEAAIDLNVTWPIALDTEKRNFRSWQGARRFWPRTYVLDADDNIRFDHIGEGRYEELNETVAWLIENQA